MLDWLEKEYLFRELLKTFNPLEEKKRTAYASPIRATNVVVVFILRNVYSEELLKRYESTEEDI